MLARCARASLLIGFFILGPAATHLLEAQVSGRQAPARRAVPALPTPSASIRIRVENDLVTAQIRYAPLQRVLEELAAWTGVIFEIESQENPLVSVRLDAIPLEDAIRRVTAANNTMFYYDPANAQPDRVSFVRVVAREKRTVAPSLRYFGTGEVTRNEADTVDTPEQALAILETSSNAEARQRAVELLADTKHSSAVEVLTKTLQDAAPEVRIAAIEGLAGLGARGSLPQILKALKDAHAGVRQSAILGVSLLGTSANVKDLMPLMRDRDASVANAAEIAVRKLSTIQP